MLGGVGGWGGGAKSFSCQTQLQLRLDWVELKDASTESTVSINSMESNESIKDIQRIGSWKF